ncbi:MULTISPECIES: hypothetical protein [unclassified Mesotoga]|uniref:hypothetical protein n=1 Tax=unclassified Mesotoga TaxID=1184398 RepID=UPI000DA69CE2|nr:MULTISPECIES: hypothetical protein [unclassified Mesotoga]PZC52309.1 hypothetical protein LH53_05695 [Mesotoga sp. TolDC]
MIKEYVPNFIFEESREIEALLNAFITEMELFQTFRDSEILRWYIDTASGSDLDRIATICGEIRQGKTDEDLKTAIFSRISGIAGVMSALEAIAKEVTNNEAYITEPAAGQIKVYTKANATTGKADILKTRIRMAKVAGVEDLYEQFTGLIDTYSMTESLSISEIMPPFVWDTAEWEFAEWS